MVQEQSSWKCKRNKKKPHIIFPFPKTLAGDAPLTVQNNAIKPNSMTCHDNQDLFPPDVKQALQLVYCSKKLNLTSNQTKQVEPYLAHLCS